MKSRDTRDIIIIWGAAIGVVFAIVVNFELMIQSHTVGAVEAFDHSICQYPIRLSNPINGCDNSDPPNPECIKFGTEECNISTPFNYDSPEWNAQLRRAIK